MFKLNAYTVFLIQSAAGSLLGNTIWVIGAAYYVLAVHMNPLQLILVGTTLEASYLIFQVPTGLFADTHSRRLSVIIGVILIGFTWMAQGLIPIFLAIIAAEIVRGLGEAFLAGAGEAWLADEIGQERYGQAVLRGEQIGQISGLIGTAAGVALASIRLNLPIVLGGALTIGLGIFLSLTMPEERFTPAREEGRHQLQAMRQTLRSSALLIRTTPILLVMLFLTANWGAFSEGFDRLWEAHLLRDITLPPIGPWKPIVWFGIINALNALLTVGVTQRLRSRVNMNDERSLTRALLVVNGIMAVSVVAFALAGNLALGILTLAVASTTRSLCGPLYDTWLNSQIRDSRVRATVISVVGQSNALGQIAGGPAIGVVGTLASLRLALGLSGAILSPAVPIYAWATRRSRTEGIVAEPASVAES